MPFDMNGVMSVIKSNIGDGSKLIDGTEIAEGAAQELANCINNAMGILIGNERAAVGTATPSGVSNIGNGMYEIGVDIPINSRPSILPWRDGADDMAALFNNGYSASRQIVYFENGEFVGATRQYRLNAQFVQTGLSMFQVSAGGEYQVVSVSPSDRFS